MMQGGYYPNPLGTNKEVIMTRGVRYALLAVLGFAFILQTSVAFAQKSKSPKLPVDLEVVGTKATAVAIATKRDWPLTVRLRGNNALGFGVPTDILLEPFPNSARTGFLVFSDPDGCGSWLDGYWHNPDLNPGCAKSYPYPFDETWVELTPTIDLAGLIKGGGDPLPGTQEIHLGVGTPNPSNITVGPFVGDDTTNDNYGFGHDNNLPGLVVLSDRGVGLVYDNNFQRTSPLKARNLAGLGNAVSYILNDKLPTSDSLQTGQPVIEWHMNVPGGLMGPLRLWDQCVGTISTGPNGETLCSGGELTRVDGGPDPGSLDNVVTTLRFFVVNVNKTHNTDTNANPILMDPPLPIDELEDMNGDGIVSAADARRAGYMLLSDEVVVQVRVLGLDHVPHFADLDGNGTSFLHYVIPGGIGGLSGIPR
jgi:hypothetical protein